ncbi:hypothetical protein [Isoptericola sp. NPDC058082]|uniref:hypothetical protein n=1 Tax=Isoptericola sp. NPDC058082 TaxID=3346331 RepID=UPI0036E382A5
MKRKVTADDRTLRIRGLQFIDLARLEVDRFQTAFARYEKRLGEEMFKQDYRDQGSPEGWREYYNSLRGRRLRVGDNWALHTEYYLVYVALAQVEKVAEALPQDNCPPFPGLAPIREVRNLEEHWEEEGASFKKARERDPEARAGRFLAGGSGEAIGEVGRAEVLAWLDEVEAALRSGYTRGRRRPPLPSSTDYFFLRMKDPVDIPSSDGGIGSGDEERSGGSTPGDDEVR